MTDKIDADCISLTRRALRAAVADHEQQLQRQARTEDTSS